MPRRRYTEEDYVELVEYPTKAEVDLVMPYLEDAGVHPRAFMTEAPDLQGLSKYPDGRVRIMIPHRHLARAQEVLERVEEQWEEMRQEWTSDEEPQGFERPDEGDEDEGIRIREKF